MRRMRLVGVVVGALTVGPWPAAAAEHGGKEHGGTAQEPSAATHEHGGETHEHAGAVAHVEPSAEQIRQTIRDFIELKERVEGAVTVEDEATKRTRSLKLEQVHERVGKTGQLFYSCADMRDLSTGELLDLDLDVEAKEDQLQVVAFRIHKVNGQPRYTYNEKDERIPVM